jgi:hypothetical protein
MIEISELDPPGKLPVYSTTLDFGDQNMFTENPQN